MIGFIGLSHLGLNYSLASAAKGFEVIAYDPNPDLTAHCNRGEFPIEEPGFKDLFALHRKRLHYTSEASRLAECDLVFYALDVKTNDRNESDLNPLTQLIHGTVAHISAGATVVILSQVSPGYTRRLISDLMLRREVKVKSFYYQVETLIFGNAVHRAMEPERYIVGSPDTQKPLPASLNKWHTIFGCPVLVMRLESAELAKIAINFFLVSTVTTSNVLAEVCEAIGADWSEIIPALRLDKRIGPQAYLKPGLGIAGGNLERDLVTVQKLAAQHGADDKVIHAWQANSQYRRDWALRQVHRELLAQNKDPLLAVWGLAYKPDTRSVKNSPSLELLRALRQSRICAHDPAAKIDSAEFPRVTICTSPLETANNADALLVMTPWKAYASINLGELKGKMRGRLIIDPYAALDGSAAQQLGFAYHRLGC